MQTSSKTCPSQSQLMTTTEPGNASSPIHNYHFPITPASETHRLRVLIPGWGVYFSSEKQQYSLSSFDCELADGVEAGLPLHLLGHQVLLMFCQLTTDGARLLGPQIQRLVLLTLKTKRTGLLESTSGQYRKQLEENRKCWDWTFIE